jgi:hypothetical protein
MRAESDEIEVASPFRGEPGEPSPDAVGGWPADQVREYSEYALRTELLMFVRLYGWEAAHAVVAGAQAQEGE